MLQELKNQINMSHLTDNQEVKNEVLDFISRIVSSSQKKGKIIDQGKLEHIIDAFLATGRTKLRKMSYKDAVRLSEEWTASLNKKAANIIETEEDVKVLKRFKSGMQWVRLVGKAAFEREGKLMSHCVGSYYEKSKEDKFAIYSLRDVNNMPHCTLEVAGKDSINQIKGKGNGSIHPKYIKYVIDILTKHFKLPVRDSELENLGYKHIAGEALHFLEANFKIKKITFQNKVYCYMNSLK